MRRGQECCLNDVFSDAIVVGVIDDVIVLVIVVMVVVAEIMI
jgi:hypothetical protein